MSDDTGAGHRSWVPGATLAVITAGLAVPLPTLLFQRGTIASDLGLREPLVGETVLAAAIAVAAAFAWLWVSPRLGSKTVGVGGGVAVGAGWFVIASANQVGLFLIGLAVAASGAGAIAVSHRPLLVTLYSGDSQHRALSNWWAALAAGAASTLVVSIAEPVSWSTTFVVGAITTLAGCGLAAVKFRQFDAEPTSEGIRALRTGWVKRSAWTAAAVGMVGFGAAEPVFEILVGKWELNPEGSAAVLATAAGGFALAALVAHWYIGTADLARAQRAHVVGTGLLLAGGLAAFGASSFTYIGLVASWGAAGAALGVVAVALDLATLPDLEPDSRRKACAWTFAALVLGALVGAALLAGPLDGLDADVQVALLSGPLAIAGLLIVFRSGDSPISAHTDDELTAIATTTPPTGSGRPPVLLTCTDLEVSYANVQALFGVDLEIGVGEVVALLGANGAGKTTTLRTISGLEPAQSGRVVFSGVDITAMPATWRVGLGISQVVGGEAVVDSLSVAENLRLFGHSLSRREREEGTTRAFDLFPRLEERSAQPAVTLSGGEKQMLALARAILTRPRLLIIDEFSLGLAPVVVSALLPVLEDFKSAGTAILIVEQSVNTALELADHVYCIERGEIVYEGDAEAIRSDPDTLHTVLVEGVTRALED